MCSHPSKDIALDASRLFFSRLPREIRDQIYHYLWSTIFLAFRHNRLVTIGHYDTNSGYSVVNSLPSWLMTNHQFLNEGLQQFYCYAQFTVGEYNTLPLYLLRTSPRPPSIAPEIPAPKNSVTNCEFPIIKDTSSRLLNLKRVRNLKVKNFCVSFQISYISRDGCTTPISTFCRLGTNHCCRICMKVSLEPDSRAERHPFQHSEALYTYFQDDDLSLQVLELDIKPSTPGLENSTMRGITKLLMTVPEDVTPDIRYDWTLFDKLPKTLRRINIGLIDDIYTPRGIPAWCVVALESVRNKCEEVISNMVDLRGGEREQEVVVKTWSFIRKGCAAWWYARPSLGQEDWFFISNSYLCLRWEADSPLYRMRSECNDDIDSIVARSGVGSSIISQKMSRRKLVSRCRLE